MGEAQTVTLSSSKASLDKLPDVEVARCQKLARGGRGPVEFIICVSQDVVGSTVSI